MSLKLTHDPEADAVYVYLEDKPYARGVDLDDERRVDYAEDGTPIGVELTCVSVGVDLRGLPRPDEIAEALRKSGIRELA